METSSYPARRCASAPPSEAARLGSTGRTAAPASTLAFIAKGKAKGQVGLEHEHLPDARSAEKMKVLWRERLEAHKTLLEG